MTYDNLIRIRIRKERLVHQVGGGGKKGAADAGRLSEAGTGHPQDLIWPSPINICDISSN